jgi:type IV secretory pathway TraG/TraD family ATPase VirD4
MISTLIVLLVLAAGAWAAWREYSRPLSLGLGGIAILPAVTLAKQVTWPMIAVAAALAGLVAWHRWARTSATVTRWGARIRRKSGVASSLDIFRFASAHEMRKKATTVRPSMAELSRWRRFRLPTNEVAVQLCRVGAQRVWSSVEDVTLVFGGPRVGKSGWLAGRIIDAPGAAVVTSTRTDLYDLTAELRGRRGPVYVFNAVGLADLPSTITFDPLTGCTDPVSAAERATDMIAASAPAGAGVGDRAYWDGQARRILAAMLHAAALGKLSMRDVLEWVANPDDARDSITSILRRSPEPGYVDEVRQFIATNDRTRTSITSTIMPALGWLTSPAASAAASGEHEFNVQALLDSNATVYLLGAEETHAAPLVCALTGHIAREARRIAARQPSGRLDPPLGLFLDEAALISPIPLHSWSADMGGRGVTIVPAFQSRAQLIDRYGEAKAAVILNNAAAKLLFGGTGDRDDLMFWSTLAGDRDEPIRTTDMNGRVASRTTRKVPVLAPAQLANLPAGRVVAFRRGISPVVGRAQMAWKRPDVRAQLHPDAAGVRARAQVARAASATGVVLTRPAAAVGVAVRATSAWSVARWSDLAAAVRQLRIRITAKRAGATATDGSDAAPPAGATVLPFPTAPFPTQRTRPTPYPRTPAPLPTSEWNGDQAHNGVDEPGGLN